MDQPVQQSAHGQPGGNPRIARALEMIEYYEWMITQEMRSPTKYHSTMLRSYEKRRDMWYKFLSWERSCEQLTKGEDNAHHSVLHS